MKFRVSFAGILLLALSLPLVLARPQKVRASRGGRAGVPTPIKTIYPTFTTIAVPGAVYTGAWAINSAGEIVGNYGQNDDVDSAGFLYKNGKFKYFSNGPVTVPTGINDSGLIVGYNWPVLDRRIPLQREDLHCAARRD